MVEMSPKIHPSFWSDTDIERQPSEVKLALLWLITNSQTNIIGICSASPMRFSFETGLKPEALQRAIEALPRTLLMKRDSVLILSFIRHQFGTGDKLKRNNIWRSICAAYLDIKEPEIRNLLLQEYPEFNDVEEGLGKGLSRAIQGHAKPKEKEKEKEQEKEKGECEGVLNFLNTTAKKEFRPVETNLSLIRSRLREVSWDTEGIEKMIRRQVNLWAGTQYEEYLRPATLFGKEKFSQYYDNRNLPLPHSNGGGSVSELRIKMEAKEKVAAALKYNHASEDACGLRWNNEAKHKEWLALRKEIKELNAKIAS